MRDEEALVLALLAAGTQPVEQQTPGGPVPQNGFDVTGKGTGDWDEYQLLSRSDGSDPFAERLAAGETEADILADIYAALADAEADPNCTGEYARPQR